MDNLPPELIFLILKKLEAQHRCKLAQTCRRFRQIISVYDKDQKVIVTINDYTGTELTRENVSVINNVIKETFYPNKGQKTNYPLVRISYEGEHDICFIPNGKVANHIIYTTKILVMIARWVTV